MSVISFFRYNYRSSGLSSQYIESYVKLTNAYSRYFAHFPYKRTSSATIRRSAMGPEYPPQSLPQSPRFTRAGPFGADPSQTAFAHFLILPFGGAIGVLSFPGFRTPLTRHV